MNLILFSASYPYVQGGESNFLNVEIKYLLRVFDHVVIVPEVCRAEVPLDHARAEVDVSYAKALASKGLFGLFRWAVPSKILRQGIAENDFPRFSISAWHRLINLAGKAEFTRRWTLDWLRKYDLDPQNWLFYTYWFDHATVGIAAIKEQYPSIRLVTRAHGYDLYEEQYYNPPFFPLRNTVLPLVDHVFADSKDGTDYLRKRYPGFTSRYETDLLGVIDPGFINQASTDGVFRIISCSMIRPEKRVKRILEGVMRAAKLRPKQRFEWTHIGNGVMRNELQRCAEKEFPPNAKAFFPGYSDHTTLMRLYRDKPFDVFINLSKTEGTPVSIMEAISCGIPVIATTVGGNAEIVSGKNGILLSKDPALDEISSAVFYLIDHPEEAQRARSGSREIWQSRYNAELNFPRFVKKLSIIGSG